MLSRLCFSTRRAFQLPLLAFLSASTSPSSLSSSSSSSSVIGVTNAFSFPPTTFLSHQQVQQQRGGHSLFHNNNIMTTTTSSSSSDTRLFAGSAVSSLEFVKDVVNDDYNATVLIGRKEDLETLNVQNFLSSTLELQGVSTSIIKVMMDALDMKKGGSSSSYVTTTNKSNNDNDDDDDDVHKLSLCALPTKLSRHNHPMAVHTLTTLVNAQVPKKGNTRIIVVTPSNNPDIAPLASAIAKAFPAFSKKTTKTPPKPRNVSVMFVQAPPPPPSSSTEEDTTSPSPTIITDETALHACQAVAKGVMLAGRLVDTHPEQLTTDQFANECQTIVNEFPPGTIEMTQIVGDDLKEKGYGGLYGVGKAATCPPRLVILEYNGNPESEEAIALVGKGIVYDTGGLSIKPKTGMCGMKSDMGGAAGLLGGFYAAVSCQTPQNIKLVLCLAENAIGPEAFRNDDILEMYSGKTVEVNNCDAEGRLVLGDGVAHVTQHYPNVNVIVDMATLTGAQLVATGKKHAGILCNTQDAEDRAMAAGQHSGDLCFPLVYSPELLMDEFKSQVADMKNSVKDRGNAQTSCAGHFIESHLADTYEGDWIHVDMAGPAVKDQRGTGYGVGFVLVMVKAPGF